MAGLLDNPELASALGIDPAAMRQQALNEGLLGSIFSLAAQAGPQMRPVSALQALGGAGMTGYGMYRGSMEEQLKNAIQGIQVQDIIRKQKEAEQLRQIAPQMFSVQRGPETKEPIVSEQGNDYITRPGAVTGVGVNMAMLPSLAALGPAGMEYASNLAKFQDAISPKTSVETIYDTNGREMKVRYDSRSGQYTPLGGTKAEPFVQVDLGNVVQLMRPSGEVVGTLPKAAAPTAPSFTMTETGQILNTKTGQLLQPKDEKGNPIALDLTAKASEDERKSAGFFTRMKDATGTINSPLTDAQGKPILDKNGNPVKIADAGSKPELLAETIGGILPNWMGGRAAQNFATSAVRQQYQQAQENWVSANLRAESGAAIGVEEMAKEIRKYFPQVGDSTAVISQKEKARAVAEQAMRQRAGRAIASGQRSITVDY